MCRTLGSTDHNQVLVPGRRVLVCWLGLSNTASVTDPSIAFDLNMQGLARDLSLSSRRELLQQFVPELQALRTGPPVQATETAGTAAIMEGSFALEIFCRFTLVGGAVARPFGVSVLRSPDGVEHTALLVDLARGLVVVDGSAQATEPRAGPFQTAAEEHSVSLHAIIDGQTIEAIWNNRTALTVQVAPSNASTGVSLVGVGVRSGVRAELRAWRLRPAASPS